MTTANLHREIIDFQRFVKRLIHINI